MRPDRRGVSLLELLLALALGAIIVLGAASLLDAASATGDRIRAASTERMASGAARAQLVGVLDRFERVPGSLAVFAGSPRALAFTSWCERPGGWLGRCDVRLDVRAASPAGSALIASWRGQRPLRLLDLPAGSHLAFRVYGPNGSQWLHFWEPGISAPDAIGIVSAGDTLVLSLGGGR